MDEEEIQPQDEILILSGIDPLLVKLNALAKILSETIAVGTGANVDYIAIIDNPQNRKIIEQKLIELVNLL